MSTPGAVREAEQLPRFGPLRPAPPAEILDLLTGAVPGTGWTADRIGNDDGYPNGGLWRVEADRRRPDGPAAAYVKRTGAAYLGTFRVWRLRPDPTDPQWWGREAEFYRSELASSGWTGDVRVARCVVDDHDGCRDLWLEEVAGIPAPLEICRRAVAGLARWQVEHAASDHPWLADGWIAAHVGRYELDNERTLAHPAWPCRSNRPVRSIRPGPGRPSKPPTVTRSTPPAGPATSATSGDRWPCPISSASAGGSTPCSTRRTRSPTTPWPRSPGC